MKSSGVSSVAFDNLPLNTLDDLLPETSLVFAKRDCKLLVWLCTQNDIVKRDLQQLFSSIKYKS